MAHVISLLNHKGGVGKTTSAINIGAGLVELGKKVLLLDLDPQANLTISLGIQRQPVTIYEALRGESELVPFQYKQNFDVVTSSLDLSGAEMELVNEPGREFLLRSLFEPIQEEYDYIIIDCPPSLGLLTLNALTSSNFVYIPLQTEFLALQGVAKIKQVIDKVRFRLNKKLSVGGVIATMYDSRKVLNRDVVSTIKKYFGNRVFETMIRNNVALAEAPAQRMDIFSYQPKSSGALDYLKLCKEIEQRCNAAEAAANAAPAKPQAQKLSTVATRQPMDSMPKGTPELVAPRQQAAQPQAQPRQIVDLHG
jgi:chromosome partitioning protein